MFSFFEPYIKCTLNSSKMFTYKGMFIFNKSRDIVHGKGDYWQPNTQTDNECMSVHNVTETNAKHCWITSSLGLSHC